MAEQHHHGHHDHLHADGQTHADNEHARVHDDEHQHHHAHDDGHSHAHGHDHGHNHGQGHGHGHDYAASNREYFDKLAANYEEQPLVKELCANISQAFLKEYHLEKEKTRVLDFACGSGLISRNIFPYARGVIGVDISQGMLNVYTRNAQRAGIPSEVLHAINIDLLEDGNTEASKEAIEQLGGKFDVVVCSMAYHHIPSIQAATSVLASLLNPGGKLLVSDGDRNKSPTPSDDDTLLSSITSPTPQPFHPSNFFDDKKYEFKEEEVIPHDFGVVVETMREVFEAAGLRDDSVKRRIKVEGTTVGDVQAQTAYLLVVSGMKA